MKQRSREEDLASMGVDDQGLLVNAKSPRPIKRGFDLGLHKTRVATFRSYFGRSVEAFTKQGEAQNHAAGGRGRNFLFLSFIAFVILPALSVLIYSAIFASDMYVSEAKITVRENSDPGGGVSIQNMASSFLSKAGLSKTGDAFQNSMIVVEYVKSRSAVEDVGGRTRLETVFGRPDIDWFSRLGNSRSVEDLVYYWNESVSASIDTLSNIVTVKVKAFSPADTLELSNSIISNSESLVNKISKRSREDALARASEEVEKAIKDLASARGDLLVFQQKASTIDPLENAKQISTVITELTTKKIEVEGRLALAESVGNSNRPGANYLRSQLKVINSQIEDLNKGLTGSEDDGSVSVKLRDFEVLRLRQEFAEQILMLARSSFEEARRQLTQQQLYLVVVVPPMKPDEATFPRVIIGTSLVFLASFLLWSIGCLLVANIRDSTQH